jgi:DNA-binding beta-propeller fold protein YncE
MLALVTGPVQPPAQAATWTEPVFQRVVGGPASPQVYAWGTVHNPVTGELLVSDYVNKTVRRYSAAGEYLGNTEGPSNIGLYAGLSADPRDGSFYVSTQQGGGGQVIKFDRTGRHLFTVDPPGLSPFTAVDDDGYLYTNQRTQGSYVDKWAVDDASGSLTHVQRFSAPGGRWYNDVAVDSQGRVYAVQQDQYRVRVFSADGTLVDELGGKGKGPGRFNGDMRGLSVDEDRNRLYVVDAAANQVEVFDLDGNPVATWGDGVMGEEPGRFQDGGRQVTVGADGTVYVADYGNFRVVPFAPDGTPLTPFPEPKADPDAWGFNSIMDVAVDPVDGAIVAVDSYNQRYQRFTSQGELVGTWGRRGNGPPYGFNYPKGIGVDPDSRNVWVVHQEIGAPDITVHRPSGEFVMQVLEPLRRDAVAFRDGEAFVLASGTITVRDAATGAEKRRWSGVSGRNLGIDQATGNLYVPNGNQVRVYSPTGTPLASLSGGSALYDAVVVGDVVYVTDRAAGRIIAFDKNTRAVLGTVGSKGSLPGQLAAPHGIAADPAGNLYVADRNNQRISVFGADGVPADATRPTVTPDVPAGGMAVPSGPVVVTGTAADGDAGVARVEVSLRDTATGLWWNPKTSAWRVNRAWDTAFGHGPVSSLEWRYAFQGAHPGGQYAFSVRARDRAGLVSPVLTRQLRAG